ncbi:unnamed protein product [marine sediment metagenome]|uniref:Uncharacterized protein n=1 Tax=marine sediment metagenome TaxID=412755 RepID=X1BVQ1_9ZZZZ
MKSKVKNSKYAKESLRRLIKQHQGVFDRLARGSPTNGTEKQ